MLSCGPALKPALPLIHTHILLYEFVVYYLHKHAWIIIHINYNYFSIFILIINWFNLQLSYADTHPMFSNTDFPNFFRVVPSENAFNAPRLALLRHFNWTRVGTIYQNEPRYALVSFKIYHINICIIWYFVLYLFISK